MKKRVEGSLEQVELWVDEGGVEGLAGGQANGRTREHLRSGGADGQMNGQKIKR
jgi:hypothetical protein